jgi:hypothetical protein
VWLTRKLGWQRWPTVLLVDSEAEATEQLALALGAEGLHVFWTTAAEVAVRLSQEHFFDLVIIDAAVDDEAGELAGLFVHHGQGVVLLSSAADRWPPLEGQWGRLVEGAFRRPLQPARVQALAVEVVRLGQRINLEAWVDLTRQQVQPPS